MKRSVMAVVVLSFLLFAGLKPVDSAPPVGIRVDVAPSVLDPNQLLGRQTPYTYTARAFVHPPEEMFSAYAAAEVIVEPGQRETKTVKGDFFDIIFTVAVNENRDRAATEVVLKRGERVLHVQKSDIVMNPNAVQRYRRWR